jgi:acyl transferase domain-containing protein
MTSKERSSAAARLSHIMGMTGPIATAETACSSSLVATGVCQMTMRFREEDQKTPSLTTELYDGLVIGSNTLIGPGSYISLSGPGMLTSNGRCFTFDHSADGFARGEGIGAIKFRVCMDSVEAMGAFAKLIGACVNQDGRSASMTAPHGPSQQEVIRNSMREGGLSAGIITIAECHGTGTALGDPIEVGALRGVMKADRTTPFMKTSAKTNIGHLEAAAGVAGLIKCILMLRYCCGAPNCHLLVLNPHLDVAGYPVYFETESVDFGHNSGLTGVSSFGFGGTNARADVWGHAVNGHRYSLAGTLPMRRSLVI